MLGVGLAGFAVWGAAAQPADGLCARVAAVMADIPGDDPLAEAAARGDAVVQIAGEDSAGSLEALAERLEVSGAFETALRRARQGAYAKILRLPDTDIWLLDEVRGERRCHILLALTVSQQGKARFLPTGLSVAPGAVCGAEVRAVVVDGIVAAAVSYKAPGGGVTLMPVQAGRFEAPCDVRPR